MPQRKHRAARTTALPPEVEELADRLDLDAADLAEVSPRWPCAGPRRPRRRPPRRNHGRSGTPTAKVNSIDAPPDRARRGLAQKYGCVWLSIFRNFKPALPLQEEPPMRRCTGLCGRLLRFDEYPREASGSCWDCEAGRTPAFPGEDFRR